MPTEAAAAGRLASKTIGHVSRIGLWIARAANVIHAPTAYAAQRESTIAQIPEIRANFEALAQQLTGTAGPAPIIISDPNAIEALRQLHADLVRSVQSFGGPAALDEIFAMRCGDVPIHALKSQDWPTIQALLSIEIPPIGDVAQAQPKQAADVEPPIDSAAAYDAYSLHRQTCPDCQARRECEIEEALARAHQTAGEGEQRQRQQRQAERQRRAAPTATPPHTNGLAAQIDQWTTGLAERLADQADAAQDTPPERALGGDIEQPAK